MYPAHVLATILSNHRNVVIALAVAIAVVAISLVTLYIQARTGAQPASFYHAAAPQTYFRG